MLEGTKLFHLQQIRRRTKMVELTLSLKVSEFGILNLSSLVRLSLAVIQSVRAPSPTASLLAEIHCKISYEDNEARLQRNWNPMTLVACVLLDYLVCVLLHTDPVFR